MNRKDIKSFLKPLTRSEIETLKEEIYLEIKYRESLSFSVDFFIHLFEKSLEEKGITCFIDDQDIETIRRYVIPLFKLNDTAARLYIPIFVEKVNSITKGKCNLKIVLNFASYYRKWLQETTWN